MKFSSIFEPQVVRRPSVQKMSFCATGMPVMGSALPDASFSSAAAAAAKAFSSSTLTKAFKS